MEKLRHKDAIPTFEILLIVDTKETKNILTKCIGTSNPHNVVRATLSGLRQLQTKEEITKLRQITA